MPAIHYFYEINIFMKIKNLIILIADLFCGNTYLYYLLLNLILKVKTKSGNKYPIKAKEQLLQTNCGLKELQNTFYRLGKLHGIRILLS